MSKAKIQNWAEVSKRQAQMKDFYSRVYEVVARIPEGKVTTYGFIAQAVGRRGAARLVGNALNLLARNGQWDLPCHRVVNRRGELTGWRYFPTPTWMEDLLRQEGVEFVGEKRVNLQRHLWIPEHSDTA